MIEDHAELRVDCRNELGEMPVWCADSQTLYWVDVVRPGRLFYWKVATGNVDFWSFDHHLTGIDLADGGDLLLRSATKLLVFSPATGRSRALWSIPASTTRMRFNDGHCDRVGRLWVGTMPDNIDDNGVPIAIAEHIGQICVVSTGRNQCFDTRLGCPNAICWSPDGSTFYVADSCDGWLYSYGFNLESATISERRPFFHVDGYGIPDGAAVDQDGYIWNARWGAGAVLRISPGGTIDLVVKTPTSQPTACCFGDSDRRTLYITSARFALSPHQLAAEPLAGGIFAVRTDVAGLELSRFGQTATVNLE